jgi:DNA-binding LacI/PurR family transcriptional regulator
MVGPEYRDNMAAQLITVKDLASRLHLHYTTVSKALRDHPDISPKTKQRVVSLAKQLHYHPNSVARNLKRQVSSTLGVIVPTIKNDFFSAVISGIEEVAYAKGFNTVVCQSNEDTDREAIHIGTLISNRVAGTLISVAQTTLSGSSLLLLSEQGIPLVFFDRFCEGVKAGRVVVDDCGGAALAVNHLLQKGRKRIAHIAGPERTSIGRDRYRGYVDTCLRNGVSVDPSLVTFGGFDEKDGVAGLRTILERGAKPDAVFAVNDPVALGAYQEIKRRGMKIPKDIALIGFGDNTLSSYMTPPLTTIRQSPYRMGKVAANMLLRKVENLEPVDESRIEMIATELVLREST